jgi:Ca-activated chloride channel homolog
MEERPAERDAVMTGYFDSGRHSAARLAALTWLLTAMVQNSAAQVVLRETAMHTVPIRVDVDMVVVNVTVTGPHDRIVTGLDRRNFMVYDDKVPQQIAAFSMEDAPVAVGMVFDTSGSMADKIGNAKAAALQFLKTSNPQDEFMLISFNERPELVSGFTSQFETVQDRLFGVQAGGRTALLDAIYLGLTKMRKADTSRKALLVISDGGDNHSRYTEADIRRAAQESDVEIYAVGVLEPLRTRHRTQEEAGGPRLLSDIAEMSGGRMFTVEDPAELPDIMQRISNDLRNQYAIGYRPSNLVRDGQWRRVKVRVNPPSDLPRLQVYARAGYYAPTQ